jgi:hypothetical protein
MREFWMLGSVASPVRAEEVGAAVPDGGGSRGGGLGKRRSADPTRQDCRLAPQGCRTSATWVADSSSWDLVNFFSLFSVRFGCNFIWATCVQCSLW